MTLILDAGCYGFTRECANADEVLSEVRKAIQDDAKTIRVEIVQPEKRGGAQDSGA